MKIGILSKRTGGFTWKIKDYYENIGHQVKIFTADNLCINDSLLENDFYILKSKRMLYLYAGYFLEANMVPVIPNTSLSHTHKDRIESYYAIKNTGLAYPQVYMGYLKILKKLLKNSYFPLISKPIFGSGSNDIRILNSTKDINKDFEEPLYLEKYIDGVHYLAYFIGDNSCICEKKPLSNEHSQMIKIEFDEEIEEYLRKWKNKYNLSFGHLDLVRENKTNQLYVVDAGTFPEFSNWKQKINPISSVCNLIMKKYSEIKK
ncbi:MAG: ATP-grasp domain-containing protein [Candidatus Lokiarchaeota archaeon]|nr:ATP-grasp domain-containing protein [Candidatus Lokiarchaeota archaeon]